ncbi:aldehyde dehydrogenase family protein [Marinobacter sp.]|uniref:aldehyde dehydrogenase family protein n=1 Tax=Marinobacter sp. TaxID=50741 RepID=UPI003561719C
MQYKTELFIGGEWVAPRQRGHIEVTNPATEMPIARVAAATAEDLDLAVKAARSALPDWKAFTGAQRAVYLRRMARAVEARKDRLVHLQTLNNGKTLAESEYDIDEVSNCLDYYADLAEKLDHKQGSPVELPVSEYVSQTHFEAVGVVGLIVPWNYPLLTSTWKLAPALAAGCTAILKPSEITPLIELEYGDIAREAELPEGVLNILPGTGADLGGPMTHHPDIDKLSFTGSTATGIKVMQAAAQSIKGVSLELGGKSPILVFDDADITDAVDWICSGIFLNTGQMCSATSRLLVQEGIYPQLLERLKEAVGQIKVGDPFAPDVTMGPLTCRPQYEKVLAAIENGRHCGARLLTGGSAGNAEMKGFFVEPTVFTDVPLDSDLWQEEIFGPVLAVRSFSTEAEAVELANDSPYGLVATIVTNDETRIERLTSALEAGHIFINGPQALFVQTSWGGVKKSGIGRELGPWGLEDFLEIKHTTRFLK